MSLPGKLCIGILEEDNPLKSFFRFKPILVEEDGRYAPYAGPQTYPESGCIRIVPDKNESYHFKSRMRRIGRFCVVDLRAHPDENDKIRPNKNYHEGGEERNAYIIYSDVVREPAPDMIFQILPEAAQELCPAPHTPGILLRGEKLHPERYAWRASEDAEGQGRLTATGEVCPLDELQTFDLPGFREEVVSFAIVPAGRLERVSDAPAPKPAALEPEQAQRPAAEAAPQPEALRPEAAPEAEKPWLFHDESMLPPPPDPRLSPAQRIRAAQTGLNPRRGRSLQELIDEKWQRSRLNQLGHPVAPIATGAPVVSPVDAAVDAVRDAWAQPHMRAALLESLGGLEEFGASMQECRAAARQRDIEQHLNGLEAQRLSMLDELDRLRAAGDAVKRQMKKELRQEADADLAEAERRVRDAQAEQARYARLAEDARAAAQDARKAVDALAGEELEQRLREFALNGRMLERIRQIRGEAEALPESPAACSASLEELAGRVAARFEAEGWALSRFEAMNLCVCAAISPVLAFSGPVGSGKTTAARLLAEALGWTAAGRFAAFAPGEGALADDPRVEALRRLPDTPAMLLLDDANLYPTPDPLRGLNPEGALSEWRLCLTLQDGPAGHPLSGDALDKGFFLRLGADGSAPWQPRAKACPVDAPMASLRGALEGLLPQPAAAVPALCVEGMEALRRALGACGATLSRRALNDAWNYCGLMRAQLGEAADPAALLDRAVAQRVLPGLLATAPLEALKRLPALLKDMPLSRDLLAQPLPVLL